VQRHGLLELGMVEDESVVGQELAESMSAEIDTVALARSGSCKCRR